MTPLLPARRLGAELGIDRLLVKDDGLLPTGSFKARGAAVGVARARELGATPVDVVGALAAVDAGVPLAVMTAYNIVFRAGHERFARTLTARPLLGGTLGRGYARDPGLLRHPPAPCRS